METHLEQLSSACAAGDTIAVANAMPWGQQTYQQAVAAIEGYRCRDGEVRELHALADKYRQEAEEALRDMHKAMNALNPEGE